MFTPLHVHSNYSLLYGASRIDELLDTARGLGYRRLAVTDHNGLYGAVAFYIAARDLGMTPILGVELTHGSAALQERALVLARDLEGYRTLCRLVTARHLDDSFDLADALSRENRHVFVIALSASLLPKLRGKVPPDALFAGLALYGDRSDRLRQEGMARAAKRFGIPLAAVPEVAFHTPGRHAVHRVLRAIDGQALAAHLPLRQLAHPQAHLRPPDEVAEHYRGWPDALAMTRFIAESCRVTLPLGGHTFPSFPLPRGETAYSHLARLAFDGLAARQGRLRPEALSRLERELSVIERLGFSPYFLIVWDIARFARSRGIPTVARGSAANSLVVHALGLSNVDPLEYDLYFERFLNLARSDCPDIDLDVCWRRRDEVIRYVYDTYGHGHVAMLATHTTYQAKSAFRDVAKACGLAPSEVDRLSKLLPHYGASGLRDAIASFPECRAFPIDRPGMADILQMSETIDGFPRHLSVHVGGVVIADRPLTDYVPLERAAKGVVIAQYDMGPVERMGLVKMDILAQRSLSIIEDTCRMVEANHGVHVDPATIADGDERTAATLRAGRTIGCFQIESPGMRNLLKMIKAGDRRDVIHALSLIRPGPASSGMKERFVRRRLGQEPTRYADPRLREVLGETCGVMLYQEDVLKVAHVMAGFPLERADELRKAMTKERSGRRMGEMRQEFLRGVLAGGGSRRLAETLWEQIANFAGYSYCKAHACTYGQISYQAVWLKSRWPAEFMAAVLANQAGYYEPREYIEEARRWGAAIRGPHVNTSEIECAAMRDHDPYDEQCRPADQNVATNTVATAPAPTENPVVLRVGLRHVRSLTARHIVQLVEDRKQRGPYRGLDDLLLRIDLSREETENLVLAGALDGFGHSRPELLWRLDNERRRMASANVEGLFSAAEASDNNKRQQRPPTMPAACTATTATFTTAASPALPDYSPRERLEQEEYALGLTPSAHPMAVLGETLGAADRVPISDLADHIGRKVAIAGVLMAARRARTRSGEFMKFVSLEDEHGLVECVLFPDVYQRYGHLLIHRGPYVARGTVEDQHGAVTLTVSHLALPETDAT